MYYPDLTAPLLLVGAFLAVPAFLIADRLVRIHRTLEELAKRLRQEAK
jgi:hypothetical protein